MNLFTAFAGAQNIEPALPPLHEAAKIGQEQTVRQLLQQGANINARDQFERTPLHWAAEKGHESISSLLLDNGVDKEAKGKVGWTALHVASYEGHENIVRLLVEKGANIEAKEYEDQTPLLWAAWGGRESVVRLLVQLGADIEAKGKPGWTALQYAFGKQHMGIVHFLCSISKNPVVTPPYAQLPPRPHSSTGIPQQHAPVLPQFNQYNTYMAQPQHLPVMNQFHRLPSGVEKGYLQNGHHPSNRYGLQGPSSSAQNQWNMMQFKAYAADQTLIPVVPTTDPNSYAVVQMGNPANRWNV